MEGKNTSPRDKKDQSRIDGRLKELSWLNEQTIAAANTLKAYLVMVANGELDDDLDELIEQIDELESQDIQNNEHTYQDNVIADEEVNEMQDEEVNEMQGEEVNVWLPEASKPETPRFQEMEKIQKPLFNPSSSPLLNSLLNESPSTSIFSPGYKISQMSPKETTLPQSSNVLNTATIQESTSSKISDFSLDPEYPNAMTIIASPAVSHSVGSTDSIPNTSEQMIEDATSCLQKSIENIVLNIKKEILSEKENGHITDVTSDFNELDLQGKESLIETITSEGSSMESVLKKSECPAEDETAIATDPMAITHVNSTESEKEVLVINSLEIERLSLNDQENVCLDGSSSTPASELAKRTEKETDIIKLESIFSDSLHTDSCADDDNKCLQKDITTSESKLRSTKKRQLEKAESRENEPQHAEKLDVVKISEAKIGEGSFSKVAKTDDETCNQQSTRNIHSDVILKTSPREKFLSPSPENRHAKDSDESSKQFAKNQDKTPGCCKALFAPNIDQSPVSQMTDDSSSYHGEDSVDICEESCSKKTTEAKNNSLDLKLQKNSSPAAEIDFGEMGSVRDDGEPFFPQVLPIHKESKKEGFPGSCLKSSEAILHSSEESDSENSDSISETIDNKNIISLSSPTRRKAKSPQYKAWKNTISIVHRDVLCHKYANIFLHKVTNDVAPSYSHVVSRPMDLSMIKKSIDNGEIRTTEEYYRNMLLMFQNAIMYNSSHHDIYKMAVEMQKDVIKLIQVFLSAQATDGAMEETTSTLRSGKKARDSCKGKQAEPSNGSIQK